MLVAVNLESEKDAKILIFNVYLWSVNRKLSVKPKRRNFASPGARIWFGLNTDAKTKALHEFADFIREKRTNGMTCGDISAAWCDQCGAPRRGFSERNVRRSCCSWVLLENSAYIVHWHVAAIQRNSFSSSKENKTFPILLNRIEQLSVDVLRGRVMCGDGITSGSQPKQSQTINKYWDQKFPVFFQFQVFTLKHAVRKQITTRFLFSIIHFKNIKNESFPVSPFIIVHRETACFTILFIQNKKVNRLAVIYTDQRDSDMKYIQLKSSRD